MVNGPTLNHDSLAQHMRASVREALAAAPAFDPPPSIDLAVAAFPRKGPPVWANVLFSRTWPQGRVAEIGPQAGAVHNVMFMADPLGAAGRSIAWQRGSDWTQLPLRPLAGRGERFIAPYPASVLKLMVALGVACLVDSGRAAWAAPWGHAGTVQRIEQLMDDMLTQSSNEATDALVALLHARGLIRREDDVERYNELHALFELEGLHTLRLANTQANGGWRNGDGAGVGQIQMTAWDTLRMLWRVSPDLPAAPWCLPGAAPWLSPASAQRLWGWLAAQRLHEVLSSESLVGLPGWQRGIPARLPPGAKQPAKPHAKPHAAPTSADAWFAHKTGNTESYTACAGRVQGDGGRDYIVALFTTLGARHASCEGCATDWCVPRIGAAVDAWLKARLE